jgi:AcrR family transcriptional regulator
MGRRSTHTPDELRALILDAAQAIIEEHGLSGLSARDIAKRIGYSPGTIYNVFHNLDDVILNIEARVLDLLDARLAAVPSQSSATDKVRQLGAAYVAFTHENRRLWNLLFEHQMPIGFDLPDWYQNKLEQPMGQVERAMAPLFGSDRTTELARSARVLWAGVHGITSLSTADKLSIMSPEAAAYLTDDLICNYLAGLASRGSTD